MWLAEEAAPFIKDDDKMCMLGSWYGVLAYILRQHRVNCLIDSVDSDPMAHDIARKIVNGTAGERGYYNEDAVGHYMSRRKYYNVICSTSTEHFEPDEWELLAEARKELPCLFIAQSNNNTVENEHINCHETAADLAESMQISDIYYMDSKEFEGVEGNYLRHLVIGK